VLGRVVVEGEQFVEIVDDLRDGLGELGAVGELERGDGAAGVVAVFGVPDLGQGPFRGRVGGLGQCGQYVADLVDPVGLENSDQRLRRADMSGERLVAAAMIPP
jgi:hypothetical protein